MPFPRSIRFAIAPLGAVLALALPPDLPAQAACLPVSERNVELGCWIIATATLGELPPDPVYWHLDTFPTRSSAEGAKSARGVVTESFGRVWLLTIAERGWRPNGGAQVAEIGPLPRPAGETFAVQYMEAVFEPGMTSRVHRHSGPEAWYTVSGTICLETPEGARFGEAGGDPVIVPGGVPMQLTAVGSATRRSLVLILHDASQHASTLVSDWTPAGLCEE